MKIYFILVLLVFNSSCASLSFKGESAKYAIKGKIDFYLNDKLMINGCRIHLNDYKFIQNEGVIYHPSPKPLVLRTEKKNNFIKAISCNVGPTRFSDMYKPMFYLKDTDIVLNLNDKGDYDFGELEIKLFELPKPYTNSQFAVDMAASLLFRNFKTTNTTYLYAWINQKKKSNKNVDLKINYTNGKLIQKIVK